jgi:hypothetical protein
MIEYILQPNTLPHSGEPATGFHAITVQTEEHTTEDFVRAMMELRGGLTEGEAREQIDLFMRAFLRLTKDGNFTIEGFLNAKVDIRGDFPTAESAFDPARNTLHFGISASRKLAKAIAGWPTHRVSDASSGIYIERVYDVASGQYDGALTVGMVLKIFGLKIKIEGTAPSIGVYFIDEAGDPIRVPQAAISRNGEKEIDLVVPNLPAGTYQVKVTTMYSGNGGRDLAQPRSYTHPAVLTVGGGS